jgi:hypothetical protein
VEVVRPRAYLFRTASGSNGKGDVVKLKLGIAFLLASSLLEATESRHKHLRLAAEILSYAIEDPKYADFVRTLERAVDEYHFRELVVHGFSTDRWLTYSAFPKIQKRVDPESLLTKPPAGCQRRKAHCAARSERLATPAACLPARQQPGPPLQLASARSGPYN